MVAFTPAPAQAVTAVLIKQSWESDVMVSMYQMRACHALVREGLTGLSTPHTSQTPIPGVILYMDDGHRSLMRVLPDGRVVDLLAVYHAAEECVRNWQAEGELPSFVGDFKRLVPLAEAVNGRRAG